MPSQYLKHHCTSQNPHGHLVSSKLKLSRVASSESKNSLNNQSLVHTKHSSFLVSCLGGASKEETPIINCYAYCRYHMSKEHNLEEPKLTFIELCIQTILPSKSAKLSTSVSHMDWSRSKCCSQTRLQTDASITGRLSIHQSMNAASVLVSLNGMTRNS